ncbi:MAG: BLUF domain-containing protein [Spartobacteria bacterium]
MIFQLVYKSTAVRHLLPWELLEMLERSRLNNARFEITGMLLYHGGQFLQLLEGDEQGVRDRYAVIAQDERHKLVSLVMTGPNAGRDFPDWTMGFRDLGERQAPAEGWTTFLEGTEMPANFPEAYNYVRNVFLAFRDQA